jgi:hypothetical protein
MISQRIIAAILSKFRYCTYFKTHIQSVYRFSTRDNYGEATVTCDNDDGRKKACKLKNREENLAWVLRRDINLILCQIVSVIHFVSGAGFQRKVVPNVRLLCTHQLPAPLLTSI